MDDSDEIPPVSIAIPNKHRRVAESIRMAKARRLKNARRGFALSRKTPERMKGRPSPTE
jgi:hypothetical protein